MKILSIAYLTGMLLLTSFATHSQVTAVKVGNRIDVKIAEEFQKFATGDNRRGGPMSPPMRSIDEEEDRKTQER